MSDNPLCEKCKNLTQVVSGKQCKLASYDFSEYGSFFRSNPCMFDSNQRKLSPLFDPANDESNYAESKTTIELRGEVAMLKEKLKNVQQAFSDLAKGVDND